jgi:hypothetical protein
MGCGRVGFDAVEKNGDTVTDAQADWIFIDKSQDTFDLGDYGGGTAQLSWDGLQVEFAGSPPYDAGRFGLFVSASFDTGDKNAVWETLSWIPNAPLSRPLPELGASDSGYAEGEVDMTDNILLLHLDESALGQDALVLDKSGKDHDGRIVLDGELASSAEGEFNDALDLDRDAWVSLDGNYFDFGTSDFTYSIWVKMRPCSESNDNKIAMGGAGTGDRPHMWIGTLCPDTCPGGDGAFMNFLDDSRDGPSLNVCSGVNLGDGNWHHLVGVKRGHTAPAALVHLYVDGREVDADSHDFGANTFTYNGGEIRLGSFNLSDPQYHTSIVVDEAAIWKRALSDAEVTNLYRRGAGSIGFQVRVCAETCGTEEFIGPDGTSATYFTEAELTGESGSQAGNLSALGLVGARAQYRARFSTSDTSYSPGLRKVTLSARRP